MVTANIITIKNHRASERASRICIDAWKKYTNIPIDVFDAITPVTVNQVYREMNLTWNPVGHPSVKLPENALKSAQSPLQTKSKSACTISHIKLWERILKSSNSQIILEHDGLIMRPLTESDIEMLEKSPYGIVSLNGPMPPHRKNYFFDPDRSDLNFPELLNTVTLSGAGQGYYIKPWAAKKVLERLYEIGYVPCINDTFLSDWWGFDFLASPKYQGWVDRSPVSLHTSGNWKEGM